MSRGRVLVVATLLAVGAFSLSGRASAQGGGSNGNYDPLTLTCVDAGTGFVELGVKAGGSGAPAGFTLQWMKLSDWEANGGAWFASDDPRLCKMSFSGQPSFSGNATSRWELGASEERIVRIGDFLFDETGVSGALADDGTGHFTSPDCQLQCGTEYVFRAFAHASRYLGRSCYSFIGSATSPEVGSPVACQVSNGGPEVVEPGDVCSTSTECGGCTFTQGYWKTHGPVGCQTGNNTNKWCVTQLTLGTVTYTDLQLCAILNRYARGNGLVTLAHQLIAAKLNAACTGATCAAGDIAAADALIGSKVIPPVGTATAAPGSVGSLVTSLDNFNNGVGCALHCSNPGLKNQGVAPILQRKSWSGLKQHYR